MSQTDDYLIPEIWTWDEESGGTFGSINRPLAGATFEKELPIGKHPLQLYSQGTPNGVKVTILLEELLAAGYGDAEYDAWLINIGKGEQFSTGFVEANPNSKIPAGIFEFGLASTKPVENCSPFPMFINQASYSASPYPAASNSSNRIVTFTPFGVP